MIQVELQPAKLVLGETLPVTLRFTNTAAAPCTNLVFRLALPPQIMLLRGQDQVDIQRLNAGETREVPLQLKGRTLGECSVAVVNFSYRDARGMAQRVLDLKLPMRVDPKPVVSGSVQTSHSEQSRSIGRAMFLEQGCRFQEAAQLYAELGQYAAADAALSREVDRLADCGRHREAAQQCEAWAGLVVHRGVVATTSAGVAAWLDLAARQFLMAGDRDGYLRVSERAAELMKVPRFELQIQAPPGARFVTGRSTRIIVRIKTGGYGPASRLKVRLTGTMEEPHPEREFTNLPVGDVREWQTAVVPRRPGDMQLKLELEYQGYRPDCRGATSFEEYVEVCEPDPTGLMSALGQSGAPVTINIQKVVAPGATTNDINVTDGVLINRSPQPPPAPRRCAKCGAPAAPADRFCDKCGELLPPST